MTTNLRQKRLRRLAELADPDRDLNVCSKDASVAVRTLLFAVLATQAVSASAQTEGAVDLNYLTGRLLAAGRFVVPNERSGSGLDAEMAARRDGMERLEQVISNRCSTEQINPDWKSLVRSVGSEIYSDRTFRILLAGDIKQLLPGLQGKRAELLLTDGKQPAFRILTSVPFLATNCGRVNLRLPSGENVIVVPFRKRAGSDDAPVISLRFNAGQGELEGSNEKDKALLSQTNLFEYTRNQSGSRREPIGLPLVD